MSIAIIQARSNSRRFPNKVLKLINGKPLISYVYNRVKKAKEVKKIYVACSNLKSDDILAKYCKDKKYNLYRGSLNNVLKRFSDILEKKKQIYFLRITGDSPCADPKLIDHAINLFKENNYDIVTNVFPRSFPKGISVEVIKSKLIIDLNKLKISKYNREHVTSYFYQNSKKYNIKNIKNRINYSRFSLAVDTPRGLYKIKSILKNKNFLNFNWKKILFLKKK